MTQPTIDPTTATRHALVCWLLDDAEHGTLCEWAGLWLESLSERELREWVRDALPFAEPDPEPLPPTRSLTDTERAVLRGMLVNDKLHYAYARGYYDGRANGVSESPFVYEADEMHQMYKYGYDRGVADYCEFDLETPLLDARATQCDDCDTILAKQDASVTTAGRIVCPTCAEATV